MYDQCITNVLDREFFFMMIPATNGSGSTRRAEVPDRLGPRMTAQPRWVRIIVALVLFGCGSLYVGCQKKIPDSFPKTYPAKMNVTRNGKPLKDIKVFLQPVEGTFRWSIGGDSDAAGDIEFTTVQGSYSVRGVPAGYYIVTVVPAQPHDIEIKLPESMLTEPPEVQARYVAERREIAIQDLLKKSKVPVALALPDTSPIRWQVAPKGTNKSTVNLDDY